MADKALEGRLEDIKFYKQEYGVGTQDALSYLRSQTDLSNLRDRVIKNLEKQGVKRKPTHAELSKVIDYAAYFSNRVLGIAADEKGLELDKTERDVTTLPYSPHMESVGSFATSLDILLNFDYEHFATEFFKQNGHKNPGEVLERLTGDIMKGDHPYYTDNGGNSFTLAEFCLFDDNLVTDIEAQYPFGRDQALLNFAMDKNALETGEDPDPYNFTFAGPLPEEVYHLLRPSNGNVYQRVVIDKTLKYLWTERRIALHAVLGMNPEESPSDQVQLATEHYREKIMHQRGDYENEIGKGTHEWLLERSLQNIQKSGYTMKAIRQNRKWLVNVLKNQINTFKYT
ncbi:hypothetical protein GOV09_05045 [Candidatus Woesearchaeota archaeon]|nr:hypothetical protein [Candidatus Woesearchaeota archaeon]